MKSSVNINLLTSLTFNFSLYFIVQEIQADKPRVEGTTIAVTAKPPEPIKSNESPAPKENEQATQPAADKHSSTEKHPSKRLDSSSSSLLNKGNSGLRRSQSETTTNRPKRYHEIINTNPPSTGEEESNTLRIEESDISRRHSTPVKPRLDANSEKVDSEKNKEKNRHRRLRSDGTPLSESKRSGKRTRYHTIDISTPNKSESENGSDKALYDTSSSQVGSAPTSTNSSQSSVLHRNNNNVNIESLQSSHHDTNKRSADTAPLATQEDLDVDIDEGRPRTLSDLSSHSSEDLERMDIPRRQRSGLRVMMDPSDASPSPSKRTIQRRKHAIDRRSRHTLDGSMHVPIPSSDNDSESSKVS